MLSFSRGFHEEAIGNTVQVLPSGMSIRQHMVFFEQLPSPALPGAFCCCGSGCACRLSFSVLLLHRFSVLPPTVTQCCPSLCCNFSTTHQMSVHHPNPILNIKHKVCRAGVRKPLPFPLFSRQIFEAVVSYSTIASICHAAQQQWRSEEKTV